MMATHVDIGAVELEADRGDVGLAIARDRREASQRLGLQIRGLLSGE